MADLLRLCKEQSSNQKGKWQRQLEENESCGAHTQEHTHAVLPQEANQPEPPCSSLPQFTGSGAQSAACAVVAEASVWQKPCPRSTHLEVDASALLCPFVLFPSIRFIVELKPNQQSCVFRVARGKLIWGQDGVGWREGRGNIRSRRTLRCWGGVGEEDRNWPFSFINH